MAPSATASARAVRSPLSFCSSWWPGPRKGPRKYNNYCFISQTRIVWREDNLINSRQFFSAHFMLQLQLADRLPCCNGPWDSPLHRPALTVLVKVHIGTYWIWNLTFSSIPFPLPKNGVAQKWRPRCIHKRNQQWFDYVFPCRFMPNKLGQTQG